MFQDGPSCRLRGAYLVVREETKHKAYTSNLKRNLSVGPMKPRVDDEHAV